MEIEDDGAPGVPEWVVTYGDMMSLLLTFFIMLVSMSQLKDEGKNRAAMNSISERFGPSAGESGVPGRSLSENSLYENTRSKGSRSRQGLEVANRNTSGPGGSQAPVENINHGKIVTIGGTVTFEQFTTGLDESSLQHLDRLVRTLQKKPHRIIVRGHSFAEPVRQNPQFRSQHDLSFARAKTVAKYLIEQRIDPRRVLVSAAGDAEPRILTRKIEDRRLNRRVDVFTIDSYVSPPEEAGNPPSNG